MKVSGAIGIIAAILGAAIAFPYPQNFEEAVRQAQQMSLIPNGAQIDRTSPAIQVRYKEYF
jgi:hypothetical protein